MKIEIRLFNSLRKYGPRTLEVEEGSPVSQVIRQLGIPPNEIFVVLLNGRNITSGSGRGIEGHFQLQSGDVLALSGPVPWSRAYGSAVV